MEKHALHCFQRQNLRTIFYDSLLSLVGELSSDVRTLDFSNEEVPNFVPSVKKSFAARGRSGMSKNVSEFPFLDLFVLHVIATDHGVGASIDSVVEFDDKMTVAITVRKSHMIAW